MFDVFKIYRLYFIASTLGAHSNFAGKGFRARDVRFLLELFLNWMDATNKDGAECIHNTQIARFLMHLTREGSLTKKGAEFRLTRPGILHLVTELTRTPVLAPLEQFFFVYYFTRNYGTRLRELVSEREGYIPPAFQIELDAILDPRELIARQTKYVQTEIRKLDGRVHDTRAARELTLKTTNAGESLERAIARVEQTYPYELNSTKPMSALMHEVPPELRHFELTVGNQNRADLLWEPMRTYLKGYLAQLKALG